MQRLRCKLGGCSNLSGIPEQLEMQIMNPEHSEELHLYFRVLKNICIFTYKHISCIYINNDKEALATQ
jgi:hypothetical protein